jgi:hypothetical protein|tara:strand:- start:204 stop:803 length:600 start_codon:yes stop_codon:yes gene_type:complete
MSDSTSISNLPSNNVKLTTTETPVQSTTSQSPPLQQQPGNAQASSITELSSKAINDIVSGIQAAAQNGMTSLQSRDIPSTTPHLTQDDAVKPNYVPKPSNKDYIEEHDSYQSLIEKNQNNVQHKDKMNNIYDEIQNPLMGMILFFFFQMPYFTKLLKKQLPSLFNKDGLHNFSGHLFKASLFGFAFFGITKVSNYLSDM